MGKLYLILAASETLLGKQLVPQEGALAGASGSRSSKAIQGSWDGTGGRRDGIFVGIGLLLSPAVLFMSPLNQRATLGQKATNKKGKGDEGVYIQATNPTSVSI